MKNGFLSIVTITFNNFEELTSTVESVKDLVNIESIIINGGNCTRTKEFLGGYLGVSISEKDQGISDAFNKGIHNSTGEFIVFLNSGDVLIDKTYYKKALELLYSDKNISFIHSNIIFEDALVGSTELTPKDVLPNMPFWHPTLIVRRSVFESIGVFDENLRSGMDLDFVYRMLASGYRGYHIPLPTVRMDGRGISSSQLWLGFKEKVKIVLKNKDYKIATFLSLANLFLRLIMKRFFYLIGAESIIRSIRKEKYRKKYSGKLNE